MLVPISTTSERVELWAVTPAELSRRIAECVVEVIQRRRTAFDSNGLVFSREDVGL